MSRILLGALIAVAASAAGLRAAGAEDAAPRLEPPLEPREALRAFELAAGFRIELVLAEPLVADPIAITWDAAGNLVITEMADYPTGAPGPETLGGGRIRIAADRDGDGRYEHTTIFAQGLPFPSGALPYRAGLLVTAAPDILYLKDSDGDGIADVRRPVVTGFREGNQQLRVNGLYYGLDYRIYGANGRSGGRVRPSGAPASAAVNIDRFDFRFDADDFKVEAIAGVSQFGHAIDDLGRRFLSWNTIHIRQEMLAPADLERHPHLRDTETVAHISDHGDSARIYPLVPPPRTFNHEPTDHFNASCGLAIERGGRFPAAYAGSAFVCEPLVGLVHRDRLVETAGAELVAERGEDGREFLASRDPWFHPVNLRSGPDGALYVVDLYRELVEHPDFVPKEVRDAVDWTKGRGHGRIWRILPLEGEAFPPLRLVDLEAPALVRQLSHPNAWRRETAARLLIERARSGTIEGPGRRDLLERLRALAWRGEATLGRIHALWTLFALGGLDAELVRRGLESARHEVRYQAVRLCRELPELLARDAEVGAALLGLAGDARVGVRFQVALALGDLPPGVLERERLAALVELARRDGGNKWFQKALLSSSYGSAQPLLAELVRPALVRDAAGAPPPRELVSRLAVLAGHGGEESAARGFALARQAFAAGRRLEALVVLEGAARGVEASGRRLRARLADRGASESELSVKARELYRLALALLAGEPTEPTPDEVLAALAALAFSPYRMSGETLVRFLDHRQPLDAQEAAARALGAQADEAADSALLETWPRATTRLRRAILAALLRREAGAAAVARSLGSAGLAARDLLPAERKQLLAALKGTLREETAGRLEPSTTSRADVIERYRKAAAGTGDAARGAKIFAEHCTACHRFRGVGAAVGPDLSGIGKKDPLELLIAILDPNRSIASGYTPYVLVTTDGQVLSGILTSETARAVTLRLAGGEDVTVLRESIVELTAGSTLMPERLEEVLDVRDLRDLVEHLRSAAR